jgi:CheY-like chemotaxis protein
MSTQPAKTLLVVEDNDSLREALAVLLQREGYDVVLAANGSQALGHLQASVAPDLILLDLFMPVLDGWKLLDLLRRQAPAAPVPVIVTSASTDEARQWSEAHGCASFLPKPTDPAELLRELRRLLPVGQRTEARKG